MTGFIWKELEFICITRKVCGQSVLLQKILRIFFFNIDDHWLKYNLFTQ